MPIIAVSAPATPTPPADAGWQDTRRLLLRTLDATDEQEFDDGQWIIMPGATGMGMPPVDVVTQQTPGLDGAWLREVRVGARDVFLPLAVVSDTSHADYLTKLARLQGLLDFRAVADVTAADGTLLLVAESVWGARQLTVVYTDGMQGDEGQTAAGTYWATRGLRLLAVDPWWRDAVETVLEFGVGAGAVFLAPAGSGLPWPRALAPSVSAGVGMPITVGGTVPVWPTVEIVGPASSVTIATDAGTAVTTTAVTAGETLILVTDPRRRSATVGGVRAWGRVGAAPRFAPLRAGPNTVDVAVPGSTTATKVRLRWHAGWTSAW